MSNIFRSLTFSFIERFLFVAVTLVSYAVIARLLTPEEIGVYSVATALISVGQVVREFGVGNYLIQIRQLTDLHVRTAFGVSLLVGAVLFLVFVALAPFAAAFYKDERMILLVRLIAINFLIMPFCTISLALLKREMRFGATTYVNVVASIVGVCVTIVLAFLGWGPQCLAWGAISVNVSTGVGAWAARKSRVIFRPSLAEWRKVASFGGRSASAAVVTSLAMDMSDLVVARILGFAPAAINSRANGVVNLFNQNVMSAVRAVALPAFADASRSGRELEPLYVSSVGGVTVIAWPFFCFLALHAHAILRLLFGPQWDAAASLVPLYCASGALGATYSLALTLAIAMGRVDVAAKTDLIVQPVRALVIVGSILIFSSLEVMAWSIFIFNVLVTPYFWKVKDGFLRTDRARTRSALMASFNVTVACMLLPATLRFSVVVTGYQEAILLIVNAAITIGAWLPALFWLRHPVIQNPSVLRIRGRMIAIAPSIALALPVDAAHVSKT